MTENEMILSNNFMDIISDTTELSEVNYPGDEFYYQQVEGDFGIFYIDRALVPPLNAANFTYRSIPKLFTLTQQELVPGRSLIYDPTALIESGILQVQRAPLSLTGSGVVVGFIDTGIRYTDDVFRNADGTSRIMSIWDQTIQSGAPPEGLKYGTEYTQQMINQALRTNDPRRFVPSWDAGDIIGLNQERPGKFAVTMLCGAICKGRHNFSSRSTSAVASSDRFSKTAALLPSGFRKATVSILSV